MRHCAIQTMRMDVVHRDICDFVLTKPLVFYAGLDRERCSRYAIQFRSCSAWRLLPLRRAPALKLPSHDPGKWGHRDKPTPLAPQAHWSFLTRILFLLKSNRRLAAAPSPATGPGGYPQPPRASIQAQSHPGPGGWPPVTTTWHPPAPRPAGDPFPRA
jgi:hypothetical protein